MQKKLTLLVSALCLTTTQAVEKPPALGHYDKRRTQFDGVTLDDTVSYLHLEPDSQVILPLASAGNVGSPTDFTFKFWFKTQDLVPSQSLQFFAFDQSVICYITDALSIMCDTPDRQRLMVDVNNYTEGKWYYLNLAVTQDGKGQLGIYDNQGLVASDETTGFYFQQERSSSLNACFGVCDSDANGMDTGFRGGIREVVACDEIEAEVDSNKISIYRYALKGYYRFSGQDLKRFISNEYTDD